MLDWTAVPGDFAFVLVMTLADQLGPGSGDARGIERDVLEAAVGRA